MAKKALRVFAFSFFLLQAKICSALIVLCCLYWFFLPSPEVVKLHRRFRHLSLIFSTSSHAYNILYNMFKYRETQRSQLDFTDISIGDVKKLALTTCLFPDPHFPPKMPNLHIKSIFWHLLYKKMVASSSLRHLWQ